MKKERNITSLLVGITGLSALGWLTHTYPPTTLRIFGFFILLFLTAAAFTRFVAHSRITAILVGIGTTTIFFLRFFNLREPIYIFLLIASLISLEVYLKKR